MPIGWFDASEAEKFGVSLAKYFIDRIPPETSGGKGRSLEKRLAAVDKMYMQIDAFRRENRLNFYKKAKLGNAFRWQLVSAGYDKDFVDQVTKGVLLKL